MTSCAKFSMLFIVVQGSSRGFSSVIPSTKGVLNPMFTLKSQCGFHQCHQFTLIGRVLFAYSPKQFVNLTYCVGRISIHPTTFSGCDIEVTTETQAEFVTTISHYFSSEYYGKLVSSETRKPFKMMILSFKSKMV